MNKANSKIEKLKEPTSIPEFIFIAIIIMVGIICFVYYTLFYFLPEEIIPYSGYAISGKDITETLLDQNYEESELSKVVAINEQEMVFKKLNSYYIGEKERTQINLDYPIYINGTLALYNLSEKNTLITKNFTEIKAYPRTTLSDGILYNEGDLERADNNTYLFIKNEDNIFINQYAIEVKTQYGNYEIPKNSIIYFNSKRITYYAIENDKLSYYNIGDVDLSSSIKMKEENYNYEDFLIKLKIKQSKKQEVQEEPEEEIQEIQEKTEEQEQEEVKEEIVEEPKDENEEEPEETEKENEKEQEEPKEEEKTEEPKEEEDEDNNEEENPSDPEEFIYIKPEVTTTNFEPGVYSARTTVSINDPSGVITTPITYEFRKNGKIYLRKSVISSGILEITGLEPNESYTITANYTYKTEDGKKAQKEIINQEIQTKGIETLEPISLSYENGELFSNKIQIQNLKITSDLRAEALKGIKSLQIEVNGVSYKIENTKINKMLRGEEITQETQENIVSNSKIKYEFKAYDIKGNELEIENSIGETRTAKSKPTVSVKVKSQDISKVELTLNLRNNDKASIENYRYTIYDIKGNLIQEAKLDQNTTLLELENLDPNQYFMVSVYADYDIEDEKGVQKDQVIGSCNFTSVPLSILGYLNMNVTKKEVTKQSATLEMAINKDRTDERLVYILEQISISIYDQTQEEEELVETKIIQGEELQKLKTSENINITFNNLKTKTTYRVDIKARLKQGNVEEDINVIKGLENFTTKKEPAEVLVKNQFVTGTMIDFDVKIDDIDGAILNSKVRMELRDAKNKLVKMETISTNEDYLRLTYEKLTEKSNYTIDFYADEYNEGDDSSTYKNNYLLKRLEIYTEPGISGTVGLTNLERISTGTNLVDVKSEVKWYSQCFYTWGYYDKTYDEKTEELRLYAGKNGYGQYYVYNLKEYAGQTITFSFLAKLDEHSENMAIYLQNSKTGGSRTRIQGINGEEWTRYSYTVTLNSTGYLGLYVVSANTTYEQALLLKEVQMELGSKRTTYKPYKYQVEGNIKVNLVDQRNEIPDKDYYISIEEDGKTIVDQRYIEIDESGKVEDAIKKYTFDENKSYKISLSIKLRDRFYVISTTEFTTEGEILGISTKEEFMEIQPNGNYIILNDITLKGASNYQVYRFGSDKFGIRGKIDFQGHALNTETINYDGIFYMIERTGKIENIVMNIYLNSNIERGSFRGLFTNNYGNINNFMVNLKECTEVANIGFHLMGYRNYGTIENFVVKLETPFYGARLLSGGVQYNTGGTFRNGYIYGENIQATFQIGTGQSRDCGGLMYSNERGTVENVYSLISVVSAEQSGVTERSANLIYINNKGIVRNVYSVGCGTITDMNYGPTVGTNSSGKVYNSYYFCDKIFTNSYNLKTTYLALYDTKFQTLMLNSQGQFLVEELISQNYYPQVNMSSKMPNQEYIPLPETSDKDLVDILSCETVEDNSKTVRVELSVNNPSGEQIRSIRIKDISNKIISQKYEDGKSTVIIELSNPVRYISKYSIMSITSQGALNLPYTRNYSENERTIYVDFYKEVSSIEEWKEINKSPTENYRLTTDIDFLNCEKEIIIINQFTGKLDGNGHTIKNIRIPKDANNYGLFYNLNGEIKNLNVENYSKENPTGSTYVGFISLAYSNTVIDNVHIKNERLSSSIVNGGNITGGLIANASDVIITNSSVTGLSITLDNGLNNARAGGLVGYGNNVRISNCFVQDVNIYAKGALIYYGIGGIIGRDDNGTINYCYSTGNIETDAESTGGIYGYSSGNTNYSYSLVNIESETDYVGGIGGYDNNTGVTSTYKNLSLGNIYSTKQSTYINRIIGNQTTEIENYGYTGQKINGFSTNEDLGAQKLLTYNDIINKETYKNVLEFGEEYNYDGLSKGILPKLYNTDGETLLPNQKDNKLEEAQMYIEEVESEKSDVNTAMVRIVVNNPNQVTISGVEIEYVNVEIKASVNEKGKTYIDLTATPDRAYDSYTITKLLYTENGEDKTIDTQAKLDVQFYKEINSYEDWQKIDTQTAQNYRLNTDIDFTGKINPNTNLSIGRLEAEGTGHTLKNLEITVSGGGKGLIKELKNSLKNITFENITINNKASSGSYTGLIVRSVAVMENVNFKGITVNAPKLGYTGIIASNSGLTITNITLEDITISGTQYVGGFIGLTDSGWFNNISIKNANITATGNYSGSVFGRMNSREPCKVLDITADSVHVKGTNYTGGIMGQGKANKFTITNSQIEGTSYVGGIVGIMDYNGSDTRDFVSQNCTITGTGSYIGGIAGQANELIAAFSIENEVIGKGTNGKYAGGVVGIIYNSLRESASIGTNVSVDTKNAGGLVGYLPGNIFYSYSYNCTVEGNENIGGFVGEHRYGTIGYCYNNNTVVAYSNSAGGMVGFLNNQDMTGANYTSWIYQSYVAGAKITAPTQVGGIIGRIVENLYDSRFYYSNYVEAYLNSNTVLVSLGVGSDKNQNSTINKFYVYEGSKINNQTVTAQTDNILASNILKLEDLSKKQTYDKIGFNSYYYNYTKLSAGKYPLVQVSTRVITRQDGIDLPSTASANMIMATTFSLLSSADEEQIGNQSENSSTEQSETKSEDSYEESSKDENENSNTEKSEDNNKEQSELLSMPNVEVYSVSANKINIEIDKLSENLILYYTPENQETKSILVTQKAYTFQYDYKTNVDIKLVKQDDSKEITINPEEVRNATSIIDGKTYYLKESKLYYQTEELEGNFVNLYLDEALSTEGKIYNITDDTWSEEITQGFTLLEETQGLETATYNGIEIITFANFSSLTQGDTTTSKQGQIVVRNGQLSLIDSNITEVASGKIINQYNGKEYQSVLGEDGKIYDLKTPLNYPENFSNENIVSLVTQEDGDADKTYATVEYANGRIITFNYATGETIFDNQVKEDISLGDYIMQAFSSAGIKESLVEDAEEKYQSSEALKEKLEQTSIEEALEITQNSEQNTTQEAKQNLSTNAEKYITAYDSATKEYVVYKESEILDLDKEEYESETTKISQNAALIEFYKSANTEKVRQTNGLFWIIPTIVAIMAGLVVLIKRNKKKKGI